MTRLMRSIVALVALVLSQTGPVAAAEQVDLLLVLSSDVSRSVDHPKFLLQREGYAAAISDPQVLDAIRSGPHQKIAMCFVEWSGFGAQKLVIDWTVIDGAASARKFGDQLLELPRSFADRTSISGGIEFAAAQLARAPFEAPRRTIDVSGDGTNNAGRDVRLARDEVVAKGSPSTAWSSSATGRCPGTRSTPTRPVGSRSTTTTTSSAVRAPSSWWRRTSAPSVAPSSER